MMMDTYNRVQSQNQKLIDKTLKFGQNFILKLICCQGEDGEQNR